MTSQTRLNYEPIVISAESTVVAKFEPGVAGATGYQSEAELEAGFIKMLQEQAYEYLPITNEQTLIDNLKTQLETLNNITFTDAEWDRFFKSCIVGTNEGAVEKTVRIQEDYIQLLTRDDGTTKNITLLDKTNIHHNSLQVINQYATTGTRTNRYDVTILVNGLPMIHIELKRRGVAIREAFNQINRYQRDSFWADSGLFQYVQLFVISNGTHTKYYSNTTRKQHLDKAARTRRTNRSSDSFAFTSWWADATNKPIQDLTGFTKTFFAKHSILNILTKYCVLTTDQELLVMRPYQIVAAEQILRRINITSNRKQRGTSDAGGYVWHTTGSGKTLTSFKAAQLASKLPDIDRVLFVVDRKDLDYQTMREYDRFEKGAANSNSSTKILKSQLEDPNARIIITTIQKLASFIKGNKQHNVYQERIVIIFDECHRSQFGEMHTAITKKFKNYHLFGFTGTPIFAENSPTGGKINLRTTQQAFGDKLHTYTILDAINDKNVLPFYMDYVNTIKLPGHLVDVQVSGIDIEEALLAPERISQIVQYIRKHYNQKTRRAKHYNLKGKRVAGFNSLFATSSIEAARTYYKEFKKQQKGLPVDQQLKVGIIFSYGANEEEYNGILSEEGFETEGLDGDSRSFLDAAIADYNNMFGTSYDTTATKFENYYKDLSRRMKNQEIDIVIVVNMFLTGFDATTLNTLWVDKNLRSHGLIQAYSRTNRILNSVKTYGNIITFRDLEQATNDAIALFGNKDAQGIVPLKTFVEYNKEYVAKIEDLEKVYPLGDTIVGETAQKEFVHLFGEILRLRNILAVFDDFDPVQALSARDLQDYTSVYLDLYQEFRSVSTTEKESILDDIVFEIELVKQVEINVDYILMLVKNHKDKYGNGNDKEIQVAIGKAVSSSPSLRNKKDLIEEFVASLSTSTNIEGLWQEFVSVKRDAELLTIIEEEDLAPDATRAFMESAFSSGTLHEDGTSITRILPPVSRFAKDGEHSAKKHAVAARLREFFDRYFGLG